jgi:hypothetical protein
MLWNLPFFGSGTYFWRLINLEFSIHSRLRLPLAEVWFVLCAYIIHMHVCLHVHVHVSMRIYVVWVHADEHVHVHVHVSMCVYVIWVHANEHVHVHVHVCLCVYVHTCWRACGCGCLWLTHTYRHGIMYGMYASAYVHVCMSACMSMWCYPCLSSIRILQCSFCSHIHACNFLQPHPCMWHAILLKRERSLTIGYYDPGWCKYWYRWLAEWALVFLQLRLETPIWNFTPPASLLHPPITWREVE